MPYSRVSYLAPFLFVLTLQCAHAQVLPPNASQVIMYSLTQSGTVPGIFSFNNGTPQPISSAIKVTTNYGSEQPASVLSSTLSASIATELSVIPIASPASAVITRTDSATGAELPVNSTLGPIFTERGETIGKHRFYVGLSTQNFHFTNLNGQSLRSLQLLVPGGRPTGLTTTTGQTLTTYPVTVGIGADVRLGQNVVFLTYGVLDRLDVSVGLPIVHASVSSQSSNAQVYVGNGLGGLSASNPNCWCLDTFTPGIAPTTTGLAPSMGPAGLVGLVLPGVINTANKSNDGFGDLLLRFKGTAVRERNLALAVGTDVRLPTGDAKNYLGTGATAIKPFVALSFYTTPLSNGIVFSPHVNLGWQYSWKSTLGGQFSATTLGTAPPPSFGVPFATTSDYLPDVFSWTVGTEVGLGRSNTLTLDLLGNQIGLVHGTADMVTASSAGFTPGCNTSASMCQTMATGLVGAGRVSLGQYSGAFGYKAKIVGDLVSTFNMLVRFDNNGLVARAVPLIGLSYTF